MTEEFDVSLRFETPKADADQTYEVSLYAEDFAAAAKFAEANLKQSYDSEAFVKSVSVALKGIDDDGGESPKNVELDELINRLLEYAVHYSRNPDEAVQNDATPSLAVALWEAGGLLEQLVEDDFENEVVAALKAFKS